ncbi:MAG: MFS transporter [Dehalococcoidia bacterium]|nr:MFS transporter [Dehalococcoidia bacterium]
MMRPTPPTEDVLVADTAASPDTPQPLGLGDTFRAAGFAFRDRGFARYFWSNALFFLGQGLILLGAQWLLKELTDSRAILGLMGGIHAVIVIVLSPYGGVIADRTARRDLLVAGRVGLATVAIVMGLVVARGAAKGWIVLVAVGFEAAFLALSQPATQSYVYDLVGPRRLPTAVALIAMVTGVLQVAGPSVGGPLIALVGTQATYLIGGAGFVIGALLLLAIPIKGKTEGAVATTISFTADIVETARHLRRDRLLVWVLMPATLITLFAGAILLLRPVFADDVLGVGAWGFGWMNAAFGAGSFVGSIIVVALGDRLKLKGLTLLIAPLDWCACMIVYSISPWFSLTLGVEFVMGISSPFWMVAMMTILQIRVPAELRSRVLAVYFMVLQFMQLNWVYSGVLADAIGDRLALLIMGAIPFGLLILMLIFVRPLVTLGSDSNPLVTWTPPADEPPDPS